MPRVFKDVHYEKLAETLRELLRSDQITRQTFNRLKAVIGEMLCHDSKKFNPGAWEERCEP